MKSKKWLIALILCIFSLTVVLSACNRTNKPDGGANDTDGEISDNNDVSIAEPDTTEHDFVLVSHLDGTYTYKW